LVQTYAWAGMLVSYSQDEGLLKGAQDTFSGEKPCDLCCQIAEAKKADGKSKELPVPASVKLLKEMLPGDPVALRTPRWSELPAVTFVALRMPLAKDAAAPPVPPPRPVA
jgi:hypothetical protein